MFKIQRGFEAKLLQTLLKTECSYKQIKSMMWVFFLWMVMLQMHQMTNAGLIFNVDS